MEFLLSFGKIVWIDVLLSCDNAVVIALACAALPRRQRIFTMCTGTTAAVIFRIALTGFASYLMTLPALRLAGGCALFFVAIKLLHNGEDESVDAKSPKRIMTAIATIVVADASMSIDNILAVAAAANGSVTLLAIGLCLSIPLVVAGATVIAEFIQHYPVLIWAGAALLGWIAGELQASDPLVQCDPPQLFGALGAGIVLVTGLIKRKWRH